MVEASDLQILPDDLLVRATWIQKMQAESADFIGSTQAAEKALETEIANSGAKPLVAHLRLCGVIPELFDHDSTPEKLYSKYTDAILCETFRFLGLNSVVITGRADVADVEAVSTPRHYDLVADAKAFRLTRTAKNQKDFKITALHKWKYGKKYATVVCPIYQLPSNKSQIYEQATSLDVCILSYSHLATIVNYQAAGHDGDEAFHGLLDAVSTMNPSSSSVDYWTTINKALLGVNKHVMPDLWRQEKLANLEGIGHAKVEGLTYLSAERTRLMSLTHDEAIRLLVTMRKIDAREKWIKDLKDNQLLSK